MGSIEVFSVGIIAGAILGFMLNEYFHYLAATKYGHIPYQKKEKENN